MDENKGEKRDIVQWGLKWEGRYLKREKKLKTGKSAFLLFNDEQDFSCHLERLRISNGKLLDIGTGTGELAISLAEMGFDVTATDVSNTAIKKAKSTANIKGVEVDFHCDNILLTSLKEKYDVITDRGCFTMIPDDYRARFVEVLLSLLKKDGYFLLKVDSKKASKVEAFFSQGIFKFETVQPSSYQNISEKIVEAVFYVIQVK